jgi:hypothetical protein
MIQSSAYPPMTSIRHFFYFDIYSEHCCQKYSVSASQYLDPIATFSTANPNFRKKRQYYTDNISEERQGSMGSWGVQFNLEIASGGYLDPKMLAEIATLQE